MSFVAPTPLLVGWRELGPGVPRRDRLLSDLTHAGFVLVRRDQRRGRADDCRDGGAGFIAKRDGPARPSVVARVLGSLTALLMGACTVAMLAV